MKKIKVSEENTQVVNNDDYTIALLIDAENISYKYIPTLLEQLKSFGNITEVLDETRPAYDLESLQKRYAGTLIGDYIRFFQEKNRNTVEDKALYYGLQALLETRRSS